MHKVELAHLDLPVLVNQEVRGFEISMNDRRVTAVQVHHALSSVQHHAQPVTHTPLQSSIPTPMKSVTPDEASCISVATAVAGSCYRQLGVYNAASRASQCSADGHSLQCSKAWQCNAAKHDCANAAQHGSAPQQSMTVQCSKA